MSNQGRNVVIVAHKFLTQPDDDLVLFLNDKQYTNVLHIKHSFSEAKDRRSSFSWHCNGELIKEAQSQDFVGWPEALIYIKEFYFTIRWLCATRLKWHSYIGMDGLCVFFGLFLRFIGRVKKVIYWAIDFVPEKRFDCRWKNKIYHIVNVYGYKHADELWDLGVRMADAREKFWGISKKEYRSHKIIPYGTWTKRINKYSYEECEQSTIVFMGHLLEKQGVQLMLAVLPELLSTIPDIKFKIIGDGAFKDSLVKLAERLGVLPCCEFKGKIDDIEKLENEVARSCVAIAPYIKKMDTWTRYADPGKVKTYLACGVPVLLTDLPWNAHEIEAAGCGLIISDENTQDVLAKTLELLKPETNRKFRRNAIAYSAGFDYGNIFDNLGL